MEDLCIKIFKKQSLIQLNDSEFFVNNEDLIVEPLNDGKTRVELAIEVENILLENDAS